MTHASRAGLAAAAMLAVACGEGPSSLDVAAERAALTTLQATEHAVAATQGEEATPTLGRDEKGPLVVYASRPLLPGGGYGPGSVWYQRLRDGAPDGAPVRVSAGGTHDELNDVSGRYVVYTAWDSPGTLSGRIVVHDLATGASSVLASASVMQEARVAGTKVAWLQGYPGAASLMLFDLAQLGTGAAPSRIAGPSPSPDEIEIGDRFLVWTELSGAQHDVRGYDLAARTRFAVATRATVDERLPSTDGPWIAFEARPTSGSAIRIELFDPDTRERRIVADGGAVNTEPSLSGDLVAYATRARAGAAADAFVYRISARDTFRVTSDRYDQGAVDVLGGLVAWVDARLGTPDVYVSTLAFVEDPCATCDPCPLDPAGAPGCGAPGGPRAAVDAVAQAVRSLDPRAFARPHLRAVLLSKLAAARHMVDAGAYPGASEKLLRDLLGKADGCALRQGPDANDWIVDCDAQQALGDAIRRALTALEGAPPAKG